MTFHSRFIFGLSGGQSNRSRASDQAPYSTFKMSDAVSSAKATLTEKLADLLGFEDGSQDVLDHLLTIESSEVR